MNGFWNSRDFSENRSIYIFYFYYLVPVSDSISGVYDKLDHVAEQEYWMLKLLTMAIASAVREVAFDLLFEEG